MALATAHGMLPLASFSQTVPGFRASIIASIHCATYLPTAWHFRLGEPFVKLSRYDPPSDVNFDQDHARTATEALTDAAHGTPLNVVLSRARNSRQRVSGECLRGRGPPSRDGYRWFLMTLTGIDPVLAYVLARAGITVQPLDGHRQAGQRRLDGLKIIVETMQSCPRRIRRRRSCTRAIEPSRVSGGHADVAPRQLRRGRNDARTAAHRP